MDHGTSTAHGTFETIPSLGGNSPLEQACIEKAFSPGNQEEHSDGAAMAVRGHEDRVIRHLPHICRSISETFRGEGLDQSHMGPHDPSPVSSTWSLPQPDQTFHLYSSGFHKADYGKGSL